MARLRPNQNPHCHGELPAPPCEDSAVTMADPKRARTRKETIQSASAIKRSLSPPNCSALLTRFARWRKVISNTPKKIWQKDKDYKEENI